MTERFLEEARDIGDRLAGAALWHQGRVNWATRGVPYVGGESQDPLPTLANLNPSVYSGTAGMAIFLARLARFTDDRLHAATARGAMEHALRRARYANASQVGRIGTDWRFGFYLGTLGIAWAAVEVGALLDDARAARDGRRLVRELASETTAPFEYDLMFGAAGGTLALLDLDRAGVPEARALAEELGASLVRSAVDEGAGRSWGPRKAQGSRNLTGWSHGASGVGVALAALADATGRAELRETARAAFRYERDVYDAEAQNWPDFQRARPHGGKPPCATAWCHGAAGIGVARTLAFGLLKDDLLIEEAETARRTTARQLTAELATPGRDFMPCHGVAGTAECLWLVEEALGRRDAHARAVSVGDHGLARYGRAARAEWGEGVEWPTPVAHGFHPPLLTGLAGVGHFLLRLHAPARVPTVLVPGRRSG